MTSLTKYLLFGKMGDLKAEGEVNVDSSILSVI